MLNSKQIITTEDLLDWSVVPWDPTISYVVGNTVKDYTTGDLYKCIANAAANTPLTNTAFFSTLSAAGLPPLPAASDAQALAKASSAVAITPSNLAALTASSADAITGTDTNKFLTAKSLADTLNNVATVGTNTKYGTLKTASTASAQAGTATDEALTSSNIPDITASDTEAQAETITNKFLTPKNLAAMQATDAEARAMAALNKFLTPKNLDALRAVLADISDTAPLNDKFVTDEHLVDWFTSGSRVGVSSGGVIFTLPGKWKLYCAVSLSRTTAASSFTTWTENFPVGTFTGTPIGISTPNLHLSSSATSVIGLIEGADAISPTQWSWKYMNTAVVTTTRTCTAFFFGKG